jgi:hypothetical protein
VFKCIVVCWAREIHLMDMNARKIAHNIQDSDFNLRLDGKIIRFSAIV